MNEPAPFPIHDEPLPSSAMRREFIGENLERASLDLASALNSLAAEDDRRLDYNLRRFSAHVRAALSTYADLRGVNTGGRA